MGFDVPRVILIGFSILAMIGQAAAADLPAETNSENVAAASPVASQPLSHAAMVKAAISSYIVPHIDALKTAATPLPDAVAAACKTGSPADEKALEDRFQKVVLAYAGVDFLRFGPML